MNPGSNFSHPPSVRSRQARTRQILRFRECQQRRRRWISIADIADWIATERGASDRRDEALRAQGYDHLLDAMLSGEFDQDGRSCILHLTPDRGRLRFGVDRLRKMCDYYAGTSTVSDQVLPRCWVPRELARRWFRRRDLPWPRRLDPVVAATASNDTAGAHTDRATYEMRVAQITPRPQSSNSDVEERAARGSRMGRRKRDIAN